MLEYSKNVIKNSLYSLRICLLKNSPIPEIIQALGSMEEVLGSIGQEQEKEIKAKIIHKSMILSEEGLNQNAIEQLKNLQGTPFPHSLDGFEKNP